MKIKHLFLLLGIALVLMGTWLGRGAWCAHKQIVSLDVHNAPLASVLGKIERQTWTKIHAEKALDARITLHVKDKAVASVLDLICEQAGARWSTLYAVYSTRGALHQLTSTLDSGSKLEAVGWTQIAPKAPEARLPGPDSDLPQMPPGLDGAGPLSYHPARVMFRKTPDGQVFVQGGGNNDTEIWSPEELVMESSLRTQLTGEDPQKASATAAAETARKVRGKWTTCYTLKKSIMGIGFTGPGPKGRGIDPMKHTPNDRFARLTPEQRVLQARQRLQFKERMFSQPTN